MKYGGELFLLVLEDRGIAEYEIIIAQSELSDFR
jgi:hypothetical protein